MRSTSQKGQTLAFVAFGLVVLTGVLGLGVDMGYLRYMKRQMQTAADAAATAAAGEIDFGDWNNAGQNAATKNNFTNGSGGVTVTITHPPAAGDPHAGNNFYVQAKIQENVNTNFARIFGISSIPMTVSATAAEGGGNNCIFALAPNGAGLSAVALVTVNSKCGIVVDSNSNNAITCGLLAAINASSIGVVGNVSSFICSVNPTPKRIKLPNPADPLAAWAAANPVMTGACGVAVASPYTGSSVPLNINGPGKILLPGTYCGGIKFNPGSTAILQPGLYKLTSTTALGANIPGSFGLTVDLGASISVAGGGFGGVTFYNKGPAGGFNFIFAGVFAGAGVNLHAPTSGAYEGVLFWQPPTNTTAATILGTSSYFTTLEGTYYLPAAAVNFAFSGPVQYNILVANTINFFIFTFAGGQIQGANFNKDYTSLANGSPVKGGYGVLVE